MLKHFTVWITTNWKILKMMWIPDHLTSPLRKLWVKKQLLQPDIGRHTGSKLGKEYDKAVYCHRAYLTYMQRCCLVTQLCPTLCNPMNSSMPVFPVLHHLPELVLTHAHQICIPSNHLVICCPLSSCFQPFQASGSFPMSWPFPSRGQSIGTSASASVLPMNIQ